MIYNRQKLCEADVSAAFQFKAMVQNTKNLDCRRTSFHDCLARNEDQLAVVDEARSQRYTKPFPEEQQFER